jgi:hypothetical protein
MTPTKSTWVGENSTIIQPPLLQICLTVPNARYNKWASFRTWIQRWGIFPKNGMFDITLSPQKLAKDLGVKFHF